MRPYRTHVYTSLSDVCDAFYVLSMQWKGKVPELCVCEGKSSMHELPPNSISIVGPTPPTWGQVGQWVGIVHNQWGFSPTRGGDLLMTFPPPIMLSDNFLYCRPAHILKFDLCYTCIPRPVGQEWVDISPNIAPLEPQVGGGGWGLLLIGALRQRKSHMNLFLT